MKSEDLLDELLEEEDADDVLDQIELKYEDQMREERPRVFQVRALSPELFEALRARHRRWRLHAGLHCDFRYDEHGVPRYPGVPKYQEEIFWGMSTEYLRAHVYDVPVEDRSKELRNSPLLGTVTNGALYAPSDHRPDFPEDPRPRELKLYQGSWKPGDPVRLDW